MKEKKYAHIATATREKHMRTVQWPVRTEKVSFAKMRMRIDQISRVSREITLSSKLRRPLKSLRSRILKTLTPDEVLVVMLDVTGLFYVTIDKKRKWKKELKTADSLKKHF